MAVSSRRGTLDGAAAAARIRWPGLIAGVGLGAFLDGIILHQVLQWHHLVVEFRSADDLAGLEYNTFWDGVFHIAAWMLVVVGGYWLASHGTAVRAAGGRRLTGLLLAGWGGFNIADQIVFHLLLGAHHIRQVPNYQVYDWTYTALGAVLVAVGLWLARPAR